MEIHTNIPLKNFTTMKIGGNAKYMTEVRTNDEVAEAVREANAKKLPIFVLGGGSNVIARDEGFNGMIIRMRIPGFEVTADELNSTTIKIGAGENWDSVVKRTVDMGLSGIEAMSAIPGTVGGTPVQNVGAFGQEISDTLQTIECYDTQEKTMTTISNTDCAFSYRNSIFRQSPGRYIITSITLKMSKNQPTPPFYESLQQYLDEHDIKIFTAGTIRNAVIELRKTKLPDPQLLPNAGSFFKNAIIDKWLLNELIVKFPDMPNYDMGDGTYKIPAGWLIESAGLKGSLISGMRVYDQNALVLVNESAESYSDLDNASNQIIGKVRDKFQIQIEPEPLTI